MFLTILTFYFLLLVPRSVRVRVRVRGHTGLRTLEPKNHGILAGLNTGKVIINFIFIVLSEHFIIWLTDDSLFLRCA